MGWLGLAKALDPRPLAAQLLDFCFPSQCAGCDARYEGAPPLCAACVGKLDELQAAPACARCAAPIQQADAPCPFCRGRGVYPLDRIARLGIHQPPLNKLIHQMKYHRRWGIAEFLADRLARHAAAAELLGRAQCLVAVPLHWRRQFLRGYNQSAVLAGRLTRRSAARVVRPAIRVRDTQSQTKLSVTQRHENMKEAFALEKPRGLAGKHIVLIDDVKTSGATLAALARVLRAAEPESISAIVVAVADPRHRDFTRV